MSKYQDVHALSFHGLTLREIDRRSHTKEETVKKMLKGKLPASLKKQLTLWTSY